MSVTISKPEAAEAVSNKESRFTRLRYGVGSLVALVAMIVLPASNANAVSTYTPPADPTGGQLDTIATQVTSWVAGYGVPVLFGLTLVGIGIRLALKYAKRATRAV